MKLGINRRDLSNAFVTREKEIYADAKDKEKKKQKAKILKKKSNKDSFCLLYTSPSPRDATLSRMPSSA